jgi:methylmalonyl-CoA mutase N-terminal domain/subunit
VADAIDPLGGSWFIEEITDRMEGRAEELLSHVDRLGGGSMLAGVLRGIEEGWFQRALGDAAYEFEKAVACGERVIVGVNRFVQAGAEDLEILRIPAELEGQQCGRLQAGRAARDQGAVERSLAALVEAARGEDNLMEPLIEAARLRATEGEIVLALQSVFGAYREPPRV